MRKLLSIDIDGTLTDIERRLDLRAAEVVRLLTDCGVCTVLASGNILCFTRSTAILIGTSGPVIAENGGVVQMGHDREIEVLSSSKEPMRALKALNEREPGFRRFPEERYTEVAVDERNVSEKTVRKLEDDFDVEVVYTGFAYHIKSPKVDKGTGLRRVMERLGFTAEEVIAIGDSENDIGMIEAAGTGIAVNNAHPALKEEAQLVVGGGFGAGLLEAIRELQGRGELPETRDAEE